jgi:competence protein ComEA
VSIFDPIVRRGRAETAALASERLRSLISASAPATAPDEMTDQSEQPTASARALDGVRIAPTALAGLVVLLVVAVVAAAFFAWRGRARDVGGTLAPLQAPQSAATTSSSTAANGSVVVDVAGKVRRPGLVTVPAGARVADALRAAGGVVPGTDLASLNLARKVVDGEQIVVGEAAPAAVGGASGSPGPTNPINLNTASASDLDQLPGVGPVLAQRIVDWRTSHGAFTSVSQLRQVTGIGDSKYADLQPLVRV